jgi:hypothetical protein
MMMQSTQSWEELRRHARTAERELEDNIAAYAAINKAVKRTVGDFDPGLFGRSREKKRRLEMRS